MNSEGVFRWMGTKEQGYLVLGSDLQLVWSESYQVPMLCCWSPSSQLPMSIQKELAPGLHPILRSSCYIASPCHAQQVIELLTQSLNVEGLSDPQIAALQILAFVGFVLTEIGFPLSIDCTRKLRASLLQAIERESSAQENAAGLD